MELKNKQTNNKLIHTEKKLMSARWKGFGEGETFHVPTPPWQLSFSSFFRPFFLFFLLLLVNSRRIVCFFTLVCNITVTSVLIQLMAISPTRLSSMETDTLSFVCPRLECLA